MLMKQREMEELQNYKRDTHEASQQRRLEIQRAQQSLVASKRNDAETIKSQSIEHDAMKQEIEKEYAAKNQEKKAIVQTQEEIAQQKIQALQERKREEFKSNYEQRVQAEMEKMKAREHELANMEKTEGDLI